LDLNVFVDDVTIGVGLGFFGWRHWALGYKPKRQIFVSFFKIQFAKMRVFRVVDWPSSVCSSNVMAKNSI